MRSCSLFQQQKIEEQRPIRIQDNATLSSNEYNQNQKQEENKLFSKIQEYNNIYINYQICNKNFY